MKLSFILITFILSMGCSLYESDARKFLREQGFQFSAAAKASLSSYEEKHCYDSLTNKNQETPKWENRQSDNIIAIQYLASDFNCLFEKNQPNSWSEEDHNLIQKIVEFAHDQRLTF